VGSKYTNDWLRRKIADDPGEDPEAGPSVIPVTSAVRNLVSSSPDVLGGKAVKESDVKFLIDECLSPELVKLAQEKGHGESSHVVWRKLAGKKDWELKPIILDGDWTFVTRNSTDFR
jgi:hypothetical protein